MLVVELYSTIDYVTVYCLVYVRMILHDIWAQQAAADHKMMKVMHIHKQNRMNAFAELYLLIINLKIVRPYT